LHIGSQMCRGEICREVPPAIHRTESISEGLPFLFNTLEGQAAPQNSFVSLSLVNSNPTLSVIPSLNTELMGLTEF